MVRFDNTAAPCQVYKLHTLFVFGDSLAPASFQAIRQAAPCSHLQSARRCYYDDEGRNKRRLATEMANCASIMSSSSLSSDSVHAPREQLSSSLTAAAVSSASVAGCGNYADRGIGDARAGEFLPNITAWSVGQLVGARIVPMTPCARAVVQLESSLCCRPSGGES